MKSLRDEIAFGEEKTDLISSEHSEDFIQTCLDFIVSETNDFIETHASILFVLAKNKTVYQKVHCFIFGFYMSVRTNSKGLTATRCAN